MIHTPKLIGLIILLLGIACSATAQQAAISHGDEMYAARAYSRSLNYYEKAIAKDSTNSYVLRQLGDVCYRLSRIDESLHWFEKLLRQPDSEPGDWLAYAKALIKSGQYEQAATSLLHMTDLGEPTDESKALERQLLEVVQLFHDSANVEISPLNLNTEGTDMSPVIVDGQLVYCSSGMQLPRARKSFIDDEPYLKLYQSVIIADTIFGQPSLFAPSLKSRFHDGPISYAQQAGEVFVTHNSVGSRQRNRNEFVNLKIQKSIRESGRWGYPVDLPFNSSRWSVAHPASASNGKLLIFVSDNPQGLGGTDLYLSRFEAGRWSNPMNLGPQFNTPGNELFPVLAGDSTLYFSSDGHGGLGGLDLFASAFSGNDFGPIRNLGYPINSPGDDFGMALVEGGRKGYFSSNRSGGRGKDDLYFFVYKSFSVPVLFLVKDAGSDEPVGSCEVSVLNQKGDMVASGLTAQDGGLQLKLRTGESYQLCASKSNYLGNKQDLILSNQVVPSELAVNIGLEPDTLRTEIGEQSTSLNLKNGESVQVIETVVVHYDLGKWTLRPDAFEVLSPLVKYLADHSKLQVLIESYADSRGSDDFNLKLTENRSRIVENYLISNYIRPERIETKAYGEAQLLNGCDNKTKCTEAQHAQNRRSVIKIIGKQVANGANIK
ncbi:MAG: OmpA family protein [Mangrovibacterium sp.]